MALEAVGKSDDAARALALAEELMAKGDADAGAAAWIEEAEAALR